MPRDCLAYAMTFTGAVSWGLYSALSRRAGDETGGGAVMPFFQLTLALLLPVSFMPGMATWGNLTALGFAIMTGYCFLEYLAYQGWDHGMRKGNVVILSLCADFIPWLSLFATSILLGVDIGGKTVVSAISLVMGAMITRYGTLQKKSALPPFEMPEP
jgi:drug/metabolite transporter (DMT)-like permease